jgi:hypothetical protein
VHERAVVCPHCGEQSGAEIDPIAVALVANADTLMTTPPRPPPPPPPRKTGKAENPIVFVGEVIDAAARVVGKALGTRRGQADADSDDHGLPRATVHKAPRK